jgi:hypothetical protein
MARLIRAANLVLGIVVVVGSVAHAEPPTATATVTPTAPKSPWRGSEVAYRNTVTATSLDRSAELTYNPYWAMSLELAPRYAFGSIWNLSASLEVSHELTEADDTTLDNETLLSDLGLRLGASRFAKIPGAGIDVSASLGLTLPTSLASQGDTLLFSLAPQVRLSRAFEGVMNGLTLGYSLRLTKLFHEYTTSALESPVIPGCVAPSENCDRLLNTGFRNASFRVANTFDASLDFNDWLSLSASFGVTVSWLYDDVDDARVSFQELEGQDRRYALLGDLSLTATPWKPVSIGLGVSALNPQLAPDGSRYAPLFNRFTTVYLDFRVDVAALFARAEPVQADDTAQLSAHQPAPQED